MDIDPMVDGAHRRVSSQGVQLPVWIAGRGMPLVLLHGWAMDHRVFRFQVAAFARRFRVVTCDRRGFGRATGAPDLRLELDDLDAIAAELDHEPFHLLGLSQGGRIALRYAATRPGRVRSLILQGAPVDGATPSGPPDEDIPLNELAALARQGRLDEMRRRWLSHPMMDLHGDHPEAARLLEDMLADYAGADLTASLASDSAAPGNPPPSQPAVDVVEALARAALPVLLLTGDRETRARRQSARLLARTLPNALEVRLGHSGHLSNLTEPERYNAAVLGFLHGLAASALSDSRPRD